MNQPIIASTFLLTVLLMIGLFFFIRASVKDRTQEVRLLSEQPEDSLMVQLRQYFGQRSYRVAAIDADLNQVTFEGVVRPSVFLAVFLSLLASVGALCFALVLTMVLPDGSNFWWGLLLVSPLAGVFYWKGAERVEQVSLKLEGGTDARSVITVRAHRDELAELQRSLELQAE
ncbi:cofactor assembly of complex C subunit B [Leptolyngbya sp. GGD]|uniref:cofactor assembly of complex C subunit B n=1 Tax=Leptolyngbya sp. GGD TaxID=2997907 RepID=UPI00227D2E17|nr:cofactor assembly of complex C subunit B [Leptolyngbya sp. GGD]MCY6491491.1 cofactor assembly of complex C subunit B [Leptolyngbya sp. GGD]